ncbi:MAG: alpha/beta hydrolase [Myxococcales bacterium]|nr:alpha/beta hydrolase [Myxococcales bacterium]
MKKRYIVLIVLLVLLLGTAGFIYDWVGGFAETVPATPATCRVVHHDNLVYFNGAGADPERNSLKIFAPENQVRAPVAILLHGGAWTGGHRRITAIEGIAEWLAQRGVLAVTLGYRLVPNVPPTEQPWDVAHGINWIYRHVDEYGGDPARIVLLGHSAGGHLASVVTCDRSYLDELGAPTGVPAGVIALSNAFDLRDGPEPASSVARRLVLFVFGTDPERRAKLSPVLFVKPGVPPFLIMRGKGDHLVPAYQAEEMAAAVRAAGGSVEVRLVNGRGHVTLFHEMTEPGDATAEASLKFIREIKPRGEPLPATTE